MRTFVLINFSPGAGLVHVYGTIQAPNAAFAADQIGSRIEETETAGVAMHAEGVLRYLLVEKVDGLTQWYLEEVMPVQGRPLAMDRER